MVKGDREEGSGGRGGSAMVLKDGNKQEQLTGQWVLTFLRSSFLEFLVLLLLEKQPHPNSL